MTEDDFARLCPVCQVNCNCKSCLRLEVPGKVWDLWFPTVGLGIAVSFILKLMLFVLFKFIL